MMEVLLDTFGGAIAMVGIIALLIWIFQEFKGLPVWFWILMLTALLFACHKVGTQVVPPVRTLFGF